MSDRPIPRVHYRRKRRRKNICVYVCIFLVIYLSLASTTNYMRIERKKPEIFLFLSMSSMNHILLYVYYVNRSLMIKTIKTTLALANFIYKFAKKIMKSKM